MERVAGGRSRPRDRSRQAVGRDCGGRRAAQRGVFPTGAALRAILAECEADNPLLPDDTPTEPVGLVGAGMTLSAVEAPRRENVL